MMGSSEEAAFDGGGGNAMKTAAVAGVKGGQDSADACNPRLEHSGGERGLK